MTIEYQIDPTYENYFENWYDQMRLLCFNPNKYMLIPMAYFICAGLSGLVLSAYVDRLGRRRAILLFQGLASFAHVMITFVPDYTTRLVGFALLGACQVKNGQCFTYCFELATKDMKAMLCSIMNFFDLSFMTWINLYVLLVSKQWLWFYTFYTFLGVLAVLLFAVYAPESPKWLHM